MPRRKILYLITKATAGGAQKYVYDLATNLPKAEFDVIVAYGERGRLARDLAASGIKLRELPALSRDIAIFSDIKSLIETIKMLKELRPDVVHLNSSKAAALGALAARVAGIQKIIFTVHGWPFKENRNPISRMFIYLVSWVTALLCHTIIVVSKTDEKLTERMWGARKKAHYIPLGLSEFQTLPANDAFRTMFGRMQSAKIGGSTLRLVTIGELTENKGLRYGIEATAQLTERGIDAVYVIAGDGEERDALKALAKKRGVDDRVFFPGFVEYAAQNLSGFDVLVLPSVKEGMPYVLLEAAWAGIPVVATAVVDEDLATRIPNMRLVPAKDVTALADAIAALAKAPRVRDTRADIFSLSEMVQRTTALYRYTAPTSSVSSRA
ncbi:glycosyltransferase [Candidatus Kaiserbacteria bacterium]|nr:glycosyltransferase [Candidatus Kaiserbacteria bacterium]